MTSLARRNRPAATKRWHTAQDPTSRWVRAVLGVPLEQKVVGADLIILAIALVVLLVPVSGGSRDWTDTLIIFVALGAGAGVSHMLVRLALRPVKTLEEVARKVSAGRINERVPASLISDRDLAHLARTMNHMLETVATDRKRIAELAAEVVYAQEKERAQVARDLDDSVAQTLAAASFHAAAAGGDATSAEVKLHLATINELLRAALEDLRGVSKSLHPRVAVDLGLPEALRALAATTRQRSLIDVRVDTRMGQSPIPAAISTTLYRVAQEALRNIEMLADAGSAMVLLSSGPGMIELEVSDDGYGLDDAVERMKSDPVLNRMRQRLSLVGGELHIHSMHDRGTRVIARAALNTEAA